MYPRRECNYCTFDGWGQGEFSGCIFGLIDRLHKRLFFLASERVRSFRISRTARERPPGDRVAIKTTAPPRTQRQSRAEGHALPDPRLTSPKYSHDPSHTTPVGTRVVAAALSGGAHVAEVEALVAPRAACVDGEGGARPGEIRPSRHHPRAQVHPLCSVQNPLFQH
jgi:hypothetical protein